MPMECSAFIGVGEGDVVVCDGVVGPGEGRRPAHVEEGAVDSCYHRLRRGGGSCKNQNWNNYTFHKALSLKPVSLSNTYQPLYY